MTSDQDAYEGDGLSCALELFETTLAMYEQRLRREHPDSSDDEIEDLIGAWLRHRPGAEHGDAEGDLVSLPRG